MRLAELAGKRVAIWGYGREGRAALNLLRERFAQQRFTLLCTSTEAVAAQALADANLDVIVYPADCDALLQFDVVIKSPGISPYQSAVNDALEAGVQFTSAVRSGSPKIRMHARSASLAPRAKARSRH